jgi:predicted nucleic acid-binding protein
MLIDSNVVIYALNSSSPKHLAAQLFVQNQHDQLIFAQQNLFEVLRILTHSKFPHPFAPTKALSALNKLSEPATIITPTPETPHIAFELIRRYKVTGTEVFDAYLVATMISHGITIIATDNQKHLGKYREITVINPFR